MFQGKRAEDARDELVNHALEKKISADTNRAQFALAA